MTGHPVGFNSPFNCSCKKQLQFIFKYHSASVSEKSHIHVCYLLFIKVDPVMMLSSSITTTTRMFSMLSCKHTPDITWCYDHNRQTSTSMLKTSIWHTANYIVTTAEKNTKLDRRELRGQFAILLHLSKPKINFKTNARILTSPSLILPKISQVC